MNLVPSYATAFAGPPAAVPDRTSGPTPQAADPSAPPDSPTEPGFDDTGQALYLLGVFTVTALIAVGALWAAASIDTWWALVIMMIIHLTLSAAVFVAVFRVIEGHRTTLRRQPRQR